MRKRDNRPAAPAKPDTAAPKAVSERLKAERIQGTAETTAAAGGKARPKRRKPRKRVS